MLDAISVAAVVRADLAKTRCCMAASATERSLIECRKRGWMAHVVEKWIPQTQRRIDAFGFGDILAVDPSSGSTLLIQATSIGAASAHKKKILEQCTASATAWLEGTGNKLELWAWQKKGHRWHLRAFPFRFRAVSGALYIGDEQ